MQDLLSELLELSRIGRVINQPEKIDLVRLTQEALETLDAHIRSKHTQVNISPDLPVIFGDRIRFREVLDNLVDNAAKYTEGLPDLIIDIGSRIQNTEKLILVRDNVDGITE